MGTIRDIDLLECPAGFPTTPWDWGNHVVQPDSRASCFGLKRKSKVRGYSHDPGMTFILERVHSISIRADKGWAVKRAYPSKKVWCSGLGLCLEMSLVFDFGQGLRCGLSIRHCRLHWIMAAWFVFLHFFLVPLCWYAVSERQMLLFFANISFKGFLLLLLWLYHWIIFSFCYSPMSMLFQNKNN